MKHQWMPFFWGDFLANTMHLSAQEVGAYVLLIAHAWEHNACINLANAQRIARVDNRNWRKVWEKLEPFFEPVAVPEGQAPRVRSSRTATELAIAAEIASKRKGAAQQMHANRLARAMQMHTPHTTPLNLESSLCKGREAPPVQVQADYRDPGVSYRSPPRTKSDNVLTPLPDKQATIRAATRKDDDIV